MSKTIWKYGASPSGRWTELMPEGADILSVQVQRSQVEMWVLVDPRGPKEARTFASYGTGHPMPDNPGKFIGTFQLDGGDLVFHLFDVT